MITALPFFYPSWGSNPVLDQSSGITAGAAVALLIGSIALLFSRSKRIRKK